MKGTEMKKKTVIKSVVALCIIFVGAVGFKLYDIFKNPQFYIYGKVIRAQVTGGVQVTGGDEPLVVTDSREIEALLRCIRKVLVNKRNPMGYDGLNFGYIIRFEFADGTALEYNYTTEYSTAEPDPFGEFNKMISEAP